MKTIKQWLHLLPEPHKQAALENLVESQGNEQYPTVYDALENAFSWQNSLEGYSYWKNIYHVLKDDFVGKLKVKADEYMVKKHLKSTEIQGFDGLVSINDLLVDFVKEVVHA